MDVRCECGDVSFRTPAAEPIDVYCCHCSQCRRQSATAFGTSAIFLADGIFPLAEDLRSRLQIWTRPTKSGGEMDCYFCRTCGCHVLHRVRDRNGAERLTVSIKGGLISGLDFGKGKHIWTGSAVVPVPEGAQGWAQSPPATPGGKETGVERT